MRAMILAAGRGERMRPLSDVTPKPLLRVNKKELIVYHLEKLSRSGFKEVVINIAHLGYKIPEALGDGSKWNIVISYSDEQEEGALESAGGIIKALPLLNQEPFLVVNSDVWSSYEFNRDFNLRGKLAHLILVPNPEHNEKGDFALSGSAVLNSAVDCYTFSGIGYYSPKLFNRLSYGKRALTSILRSAISSGEVSGELFKGEWRDIGTPERLEKLRRRL